MRKELFGAKGGFGLGQAKRRVAVASDRISTSNVAATARRWAADLITSNMRKFPAAKSSGS
jgi:hypothetical protein